jgi:hypothetical protein
MRVVGGASAAARLAAAAVALIAFVPATAQALVPSPTVSAFFAQDTAAPASDVGLGFTISNPDASARTGVAFSVALPAGLAVSTPSQLFTTCDGTASAADGGSAISLSSASLQAAGDDGDSCVVLVDVVAAGPGVIAVASGAPTSTESGPGVPSNTATLQVLAHPTITEAFGVPSIVAGQTATATFTIANPNASTRLYNVAFDDALPAGLQVAASPNVVAPCGAGAVLADAGATTIELAGQTIEPGAACSFSIDVTGTAATSSPNPTGPLTYDFDGGGGDFYGGTAPGTSATLTVVGPPQLAATFSPPKVAPGATSKLAFTIANPNATSALTGVGFTDALPTGLLVATPAGLSGSCGGATITAAAGSGTVALTGATLAAAGGCTFGVDVVASSLGVKTSTTSTVSSNEGGTGAAATASLSVEAPLAITSNLHVVSPPPPPPPPPSNAFAVANIHAAKDGTIQFDVTVAGPGAVSVLETLGASSERVRKPGPSRFTIARKLLRSSKRGKLHVKVRPNARGKHAIKHAGRSLRVNLWVTFRPTGGTPSTKRKAVVVRPR